MNQQRRKADLEKMVISFLSSRTLEEILEYIDRIDINGWEKDTQPAIDIIMECVSSGERDISAALVAKYRPSSKIAKILSVFVPLHVGKQAINDLSNEQSKEYYKQKIREIEKAPISERPALLAILAETMRSRIARASGAFDDEAVVNRVDTLSDEELSRITHYPTLKTGISNLDRGGLPPGMNLIIGQSGAGKSWFMNHLVKCAWTLNKKRSVVFSLEMDFDGLKKRMIQSFSGLTYEQFVYGGDISSGIKILREVNPVIIDYTKQESDRITTADFLTKAHQLYKEGYRVFIFDHFHEIPGATVNERNQQVTEQWADAFKLLRNTYDDLWLFILVQSNKEGYKAKILKKENVSGSSALVNKCDFFLSLNRTEDPDSMENVDFAQDKVVKIWVDKSRRTSADRYMSIALLKSTGEIVDAANEQIDKLIGKTQMKF